LTARDPSTVCRAIEQHRVQVLPTSPTFLNLLLMSEAWRDYDLASLQLITYGTEAMAEATLRRLNGVFPGVRFLQTYGLSELGILRSKSRSGDSLWVKVGGEDYETRVVGNVLHIRAKSSMLGYLNAPSPFDAEGWFDTQDEVEVDGEWLRFKGRKSDIINVGGEKVYPAEVESVVLEVENIVDATVSKEANPITGNIVVATVAVRNPEASRDVIRRVQAHCSSRLPRFKVPVKVTVAESTGVTERFKKQR
jgi:acyl-coenzyme A synthetase/AMP-(fatty) acid ligase